MTKRLILIFLLLTTYYSLHTPSAQGAELKFKNNFEVIGKGDIFEVALILNTEQEAINAVEATIDYSDNLKLENISDGNSIVNLWIKKPTMENSKSGAIFLSGLIPGGLTIKEGTILTLNFKNIAAGQGRIFIKDAKILRHDPDASEAKVTIKNLEFNIGSAKIQPQEGKKLILDFLPPDEFKIYPSKDKNIFDNSWFISFNAQDKGSGINRYEIREKFLGLWGSWRISDSPHPLSDQLLFSIIEVRAVDNVERERVAVFVPTRLYAFYIILIGAIASILFFRLLKYLKAKHKKGGI